MLEGRNEGNIMIILGGGLWLNAGTHQRMVWGATQAHLLPAFLWVGGCVRRKPQRFLDYSSGLCQWQYKRTWRSRRYMGVQEAV